MSAAKFTPGPWTIDTEGRAPWVWIGDFAAHVPSFEDARLIAAAPELLVFAERIVAHFQPLPYDPANDRWVKEARAAIAKATGSAA